MIQQLVRSVEGHQGVVVISDDTDVFVLLVHYYAALHLSQMVIMESPVRDRAVINIGQTAQKHNHFVPDLLATHALTGCATVVGYHELGKTKAVKTLKAGYSIG